ncbi:Pyruvate kinase [Pyrodictium delaneyi]|uniref:Pyruvate kinase n=1 Tax=Pyrodictium delaneyi TaxID=1273541 RepID=A0A0P0N623_9CREN|nr:pyruvate kinase [Pyrodictium delaneyi]ALL01759.1 Pyruvate kinase [Pyrodictium delaneyi]
MTGYVNTKIIATVGPSSSSFEVIEQLASLGVSGFRINFAHGEPSLWKSWIEIIRETEKSIGRPLAIIGDLVGPSIRIGVLEEPITLSPGDVAEIVYGEKAKGGSERIIPLPLRRVFEVVEEGDILVMNDGRVKLRVIDVRGLRIRVEALTPARITSRKAIVILNRDPGLPALTERDMQCLRFALDNELDYVALSYVRGGEDIAVLKTLIANEGGDVGVAAKIETRSAVENLSSIIEESDIVIVARGDLGMNYGLEEIPLLQEHIVYETRRRGKPVIVATQILESMIDNPVPTRAEVMDVATAVKQGVDALMLTGETAIGKYPVEAVKWLRKIIRRIEERYPPQKFPPSDHQWAYASSIVETAERLNASHILVYSIGGTLPPKIAASRPLVKTIIGVGDVARARRLVIVWGLHLRHVVAEGYEDGLHKLIKELCRDGEIHPGELIIKAYREAHNKHVIIVEKMYGCN